MFFKTIFATIRRCVNNFNDGLDFGKSDRIFVYQIRFSYSESFFCALQRF